MAKRRGRRSVLAAASVAALERALAKRRREVEHLEARRDRLSTRLANVERALAAVRGAPGPGRPPVAEAATEPKVALRRRRRAKTSLAEAVSQVLKAATEPMPVAAVVAAVKAAGHKSNAKHFHAMVQMTLGGLATAKRVGRGMYVYRAR